jgi:DNA-binding beta-propeller fold protein YncE
MLHEPTGVAVGRSGEIYVAEMLNHRVSVFDNRGNFVRVLKPPLEQKNVGNEMHVATGQQGHVYVTDPAGGRVFHFREDGTLAQVINTRGSDRFSAGRPTGIAVDGEGHLLVTDRANDIAVRSPNQYP